MPVPWRTMALVVALSLLIAGGIVAFAWFEVPRYRYEAIALGLPATAVFPVLMLALFLTPRMLRSSPTASPDDWVRSSRRAEIREYALAGRGHLCLTVAPAIAPVRRAGLSCRHPRPARGPSSYPRDLPGEGRPRA